MSKKQKEDRAEYLKEKITSLKIFSVTSKDRNEEIEVLTTELIKLEASMGPRLTGVDVTKQQSEKQPVAAQPVLQ